MTPANEPTAQPIAKRNLTIPEAVEASGSSRSAIYSALKLGKLRARKLGRRTYIPVIELDRFLAELPEYRAAA